MDINLNQMIEEYARVSFSPYGAHYKRYPTGHQQPEYTTDLSSFIFAIEGTAVIYLDGQPFNFGANRVVHCAPGQRFAATNESGKVVELFELAYCNDRVSTEYMQSSYELELGRNSSVFSLLHKLVELSERTYPQIDGNVMLQAKMLTYSILSETFSSAQTIKQSDTFEVVTDAQEYIKQHYMESHTLGTLSAKYGMSDKYFASIFKRYSGISPIEYVIRYRLSRAKQLLQFTDRSVKDIGYSVGYDDALYFSRHFHKRFGCSPSEWRRQARCIE